MEVPEVVRPPPRMGGKKVFFWEKKKRDKTTQQTWLPRSLVASGAGSGHGGGMCPGLKKKRGKWFVLRSLQKTKMLILGKKNAGFGYWEMFDTD